MENKGGVAKMKHLKNVKLIVKVTSKNLKKVKVVPQNSGKGKRKRNVMEVAGPSEPSKVAPKRKRQPTRQEREDEAEAAFRAANPNAPSEDGDDDEGRGRTGVRRSGRNVPKPVDSDDGESSGEDFAMDNLSLGARVRAQKRRKEETENGPAGAAKRRTQSVSKFDST